MSDLDKLKADYPDWRFGTLWAARASGPDLRALWATTGSVVLADFSAAALRRKIELEISRPPGASGC